MTTAHFDTPHSRLISLWVLRIFSRDFCQGLFFKDKDSYADQDIAKFLGLPTGIGSSDIPDIRRRMDEMLAELESQGGAALKEPAASNLAEFSQTMGFDEVESAIINFFVMVETEPALKDTIRVIRRYLNSKPDLFLSEALALDSSAAEAALRRGGRLMTSGLLGLPGSPKWQFFSSEAAMNLIASEDGTGSVLKALGVMEAASSGLTLAHFDHLEPELSLLVDYLRMAVSSGKRGVNILLHGAPGTGKTQLTRVVGHELEVPVFDFAVEDESGDPKSPHTRLCSMRVAGSFFTNRPALLVFDELEDILASSGKDRGETDKSKAWFNRLLEINPVPVFWLSNSVSHLDAAFVRRFDFVIEVPVPPRSRREKILQQHGGHHLSAAAIQHLAKVEVLAPAVVSRVAEVLDGISGQLSENQRDDAFVRMVGSVLKVQGHPPLAPRAAEEILPEEVYDPSCLNTQADLQELARRFREHPHGRICLHGQPGTGKTAFGHWLARELDLPLRVERASDWLSPFVGMTEMSIAKSFEAARQDGAILMVDEVDSFLQSRSKAVRSWEVTQVNELLTRMEAFNGLFIATTNRLDQLDSASLRRFDMKLRFDFLHPHQIFDLLGRWCRKLGIEPPLPQHARMLESLDCVTPGDFAAAARRHRFRPFADAGELIAAIQEDCSLKDAAAPRIGFL